MCSFNLLVVICMTLLTIQNSVECRSSAFSTRIVGGKPAIRGQFPYQVFLDIHITEDGLTAFCGGSLISSDFVLTAAHCVCHNNSLVNGVYVSLGIIDLKNPGDFQQIFVPQENIIIHDKYNCDGNFDYDIALLRLSEPAIFNDFVQPILLPEPDLGRLIGRMANTSGWGKYGDGENSYPDILQYTTQEIISNRKCNRYCFRITVESKMLCTNSANSGTCVGDSGSPLTIENESGVKYLIGINSWGEPVCAEDVPNVYTRVKRFLNWIRKNTEVSHDD